MGTIPWCRNQFLPTCLDLLGGRGRRQGDGGHGRVSGGSRHLVDPQAGSGAVGSPHGAGGRDVCLRDQHEARRVHHPHSSCKTGQGPLLHSQAPNQHFRAAPELTDLPPPEASPWTKTSCWHLHHYLICFIHPNLLCEQYRHRHPRAATCLCHFVL